jgi:hypothetical protein
MLDPPRDSSDKLHPSRIAAKQRLGMISNLELDMIEELFQLLTMMMM